MPAISIDEPRDPLLNCPRRTLLLARWLTAMDAYDEAVEAAAGGPVPKAIKKAYLTATTALQRYDTEAGLAPRAVMHDGTMEWYLPALSARGGYPLRGALATQQWGGT